MASIADVNGDGWLDIFVTMEKSGTSNLLFINNGDATFRCAHAPTDRYDERHVDVLL